MTVAPRSRADEAPPWLDRWECASGTVAGRDHVVARRNSQDAIELVISEHAIVAVLADGCGSARHSETGARLLATLLARALARRAAVPELPHPKAAIHCALDDVLAVLARVASAHESNAAAWVAEHLLATVLAVVVTREHATVFRVGDGIVGVNGRMTTVAAPDNAPPYLAYRLLASDLSQLTLPGACPVVEWEGPSDALESVVLATDGAVALPGMGEDPHAALRAWLADDALFVRPHALGRRLALLARDEQVVDWDRQVVRRRAGVLADDTTVLLLRRRAFADEG